jgi:hypothetical protein
LTSSPLGPIAFVGLAALGSLTALDCSSSGLCPFPNATAVESAPPTPCIAASVESCIDPTLVVTNHCDRALYLPVAYGRFDGDAAALGADIEVLAGQSVHFVVRPDKATAVSGARKDFTIPVRLTTTPLELRFSTLAP